MRCSTPIAPTDQEPLELDVEGVLGVDGALDVVDAPDELDASDLLSVVVDSALDSLFFGGALVVDVAVSPPFAGIP
jgi:hypothetical protein